MSYSSRRHIIHHDKYGTVHRLEVQQKNFVGSSVEMLGANGVFDFEHDEFLTSSDSLLKVYENTIQKGTLDIYPLIENSTDFALLQDIFESDEDEFRLVWKIDGTVFFTGSVINDLLEYPEKAYKFPATISAKDFSRLEGEDYPLTSGRVSIIKAIAELLGYLGYDLNIETATSWTENGITEGTDFLQQIYIDRYALRTYARTGDETDETITVFEALEHILNDNCLILKQLNGVFKIDQISAYKDPTNVLVTVYDSAGDEVSFSTIDTTLNASSEGIIVKGNSSKTKGYPAIRQARVKFDHRTSVSGIQLPTNVELTSETPYTQYFISNGNQVLNLSGTADARMPSGTTRASARMFMRLERPGGFYYWNSSEREWQTDSIAITKPLTRGHVGVDYVGFHGPFSVTTEPTPADAGGELRITIAEVTGDNGSPVTGTTYSGLNFSIRNSVAEGNSTYIDFQLTQTGGFSSSYKHKDTFFGDGPIGYARSALSRSDESLTAGAWGRRGDATLDKDFHENILKEIVDVQRTFINKLTAALYGIYDPTKILVYRSKNFFYTGGRFNGKEGDWTITLMRVNIQTSTADTYIDLPKFHSDESTGAKPPQGGEGSEGMTPEDADNRYFQQANLLSEVSASNISTLLSNINLGTTDDVQFGNIRGTTLRTDTGKILAPTDFAFRNAGDTDYRKITAKAIDIDGSSFVDSGRNITARTGHFFDHVRINQASIGLDNVVIDGRSSQQMPDPNTGREDLILLGRTDTDRYVGFGYKAESGFGQNPVFFADKSIRTDNDYKIGSTTVIDSNTDSFFRNGEYSGTLDVEGVAEFYDTAGSPNYVPRLTGWQGDVDGHFDFRRVYSDEIITRTFISETTLSLAGTDYLTRSNATLSENITFDNTPTQIARTWEDGTSMEWEDGTPMLWETYPLQDLTVDEHSQLPGAAVFESGHYVLLRASDRYTGSGLRFLNIWGRVFWPDPNDSSSVMNGDGTQTYDFQILKPTPPEITTPITLRAGSVIIDYGQSGDGVIERSAILDDSPYDRIFTWEDKPWLNENYDIKTVRGNLGTVGEPDVYGAYFKDVVIIDGEGMRIGMNADGNGNFGIYQDEDNYWLPGVGAKFTAGSGAVTVDNIISSINASTEGIAIAGNRISIDGDTVFSSDVDIRGTLNGVDGTFTGTLSGVDGSFSGTLDAVTGSFGDVDVDGSLEIGTGEIFSGSPASPDYQLDSSGIGLAERVSSDDTASIRWGISGDPVGKIQTLSGGRMRIESDFDQSFRVDGTEYMRITGSGIGPQRFVRENVGLGGGTQTLDINRNTRTVMCSNNIGTTTITDIVFSSGSPEPTEEITIVNLSPSNSINFNGSGFRVSATLLGGRHMKLVRGGDGFWYPQTDNT